MTTPEANLGAWLRLQTWLSPGFPVGSFAYSHGLEWAVESGLVSQRDALGQWIEGILRLGAGRHDGVLLQAAYHATARAGAGEWETLDRLVTWADALRPTAELALESGTQGQAFLSALCTGWPDPLLHAWQERLAGRPLALPLAVGAGCAVHDIALQAAIPAYLQSLVANLLSAGVRLIPLGQSAALVLTHRLEAVVLDVAQQVLTGDPGDWSRRLGGADWMVVWCSLRHETQYTRLFRS
ncbi:MAG: urease accessory protein UreF [Magnetococcus sp. WYHC-3]